MKNLAVKETTVLSFKFMKNSLGTQNFGGVKVQPNLS